MCGARGEPCDAQPWAERGAVLRCSGLVGAGPTPVGWFAAFCGAGVSKPVSVEPQCRVSGGRAETYLGNGAGPQEPGSAHLEARGRSGSTRSLGLGRDAGRVRLGQGLGGGRREELGMGFSSCWESRCAGKAEDTCVRVSLEGAGKGCLWAGGACLESAHSLSFLADWFS